MSRAKAAMRPGPSASDEDILLGRTVTISQIGASLPVSFSFAIAPLVFVFLHVYALTRYDMLATNVRYFVGELHVAVARESDRERCRQLPANVEWVQSLTAPRGSSLRNWFWPVLAVATMAGFPVIVLLLVQINALRDQSDLINWVQRAWLLITCDPAGRPSLLRRWSGGSPVMPNDTIRLRPNSAKTAGMGRNSPTPSVTPTLAPAQPELAPKHERC